MALHFRLPAHANFDDESICLLADNIQNEVVTIHRSQVLKMLSSLPVDIPCNGGRSSDLLSGAVLQDCLQFPDKYFLLVLLVWGLLL
jgi:hypothetical protein